MTGAGAPGGLRVGLVLGAGGIPGQLWHYGVVAELERHFDFDARVAPLAIGTSAGAGVAGFLRGGIAAADLAANATGEPVSDEGRARIQRLAAPREVFEPDGPRGWPTLPVGAWRTALPVPWALRPAALLAATAPPGRVSTRPWTESMRRLTGDGWPALPTWICTVRRRDAARVVFGMPGAPPAAFPDAVSASSAIPAFFRPVRIGDADYVDGAPFSPTSADLAGHPAAGALGLDLVVVSAPMAGDTGGRSPAGAVRRYWRRRLHREVDGLRRLGCRVVTAEPEADDVDVLRRAGDDRGARPEVVRAAARAARRAAAALTAVP